MCTIVGSSKQHLDFLKKKKKKKKKKKYQEHIDKFHINFQIHCAWNKNCIVCPVSTWEDYSNKNTQQRMWLGTNIHMPCTAVLNIS